LTRGAAPEAIQCDKNASYSAMLGVFAPSASSC
jgi:hypothetical protein